MNKNQSGGSKQKGGAKLDDDSSTSSTSSSSGSEDDSDSDNSESEKPKGKNKKEKETIYKFLPLSTITKYEKIAEEYGVSEVARGLKPSIKSDEGFLQVYKRVQKPYKLQYIPIKKSRPQGQDYYSFRNTFIGPKLEKSDKKKNRAYFPESMVITLSDCCSTLLTLAFFGDLTNTNVLYGLSNFLGHVTFIRVTEYSGTHMHRGTRQ